MLPDAGEATRIDPDLPSRIPSLDGLRAVSILMVIIAHAINPAALPVEYALFGHMGNYGVRIFFLISGFLITTLLLKEAVKHGTISLGAFYARRAIRIFPAFYVYVFTVIVLASCEWVVLQPGDILHTLTYTMNYHQDRSWYLNHTWSLSVEEQFYLLWPAMLVWLGWRRAMLGAFLFVIAAPLIRSVMYFGWQATPTALGRQFQAVGDALACGCLLAGHYNRLGAAGWYRRMQDYSIYPLLPLLLLAVSGATYWISLPCYYILGQSVANISCFLLLDYGVRAAGSPFGRLLNTRPLTYVGAMSYSLYLWQELFLDYGVTGLRFDFPFNLIALAVTSLFSYYCIEQAFPGLRQRFSR